MRALVVTLLLVVPLVAGCLGRGPAEGQPGDGSVPQWTLVDLEGVVHGTDTVKGNVTVLFFMATWCQSCKSKTGMLRDVHAAYGDDPVTLITVGWEPEDDADELRAWKEEYEQPWPHAVDEGLKVSQTFDITIQSSFVVLDTDAAVHRTWSYPGPDRAALEAAIDDALPAA